MRKYLLRWWYTPNWQQEQCPELWAYRPAPPMTEAESDAAIQKRLREVLSRAITEMRFYIEGVGMESKTVTLGSEPVRERVDPGWQATIYKLELPK